MAWPGGAVLPHDAGPLDIAVAVVVENGGNAGNEAYGATVAGPIAKDMMEAVVDK